MLTSLSLVCSHKVFGSCLHLHPLEGVTLSSSSICQDVPRSPVDAVGYPAVAPTVVPSIQISCQTSIKPPACTIVLTTTSRHVTVIVSVSSAEGPAVVVVALTVAQCITCITRILPCCQAIPGR